MDKSLKINGFCKKKNFKYPDQNFFFLLNNRITPLKTYTQNTLKNTGWGKNILI